MALEYILRMTAHEAINDKWKITKVRCNGARHFARPTLKTYVIAMIFKCIALSKYKNTLMLWTFGVTWEYLGSQIVNSECQGLYVLYTYVQQPKV